MTQTCLLHRAVLWDTESSGQAVVQCDFSSAFNIEQPHLTGHKLLQMYVSPHLILWVLSFLPDRKQLVKCNGCDNSMKTVSAGSPQGSDLSSTVYLLHRWWAGALKLIFLFKYSDDTVTRVSVSRHLAAIGRLQFQLAGKYKSWRPSWMVKFLFYFFYFVLLAYY